jgi:hypothetical protein
VSIKPTIDKAFAVGINGAENTWENLERESVPNLQFYPEAPRTEVGQCQFSKAFCGYCDFILHLFSNVQLQI